MPSSCVVGGLVAPVEAIIECMREAKATDIFDAVLTSPVAGLQTVLTSPMAGAQPVLTSPKSGIF